MNNDKRSLFSLIVAIIIPISGIACMYLYNKNMQSMANAGLQQCLEISDSGNSVVLWKKECYKDYNMHK